jgi:hypothetical protein
MVKPPIIINNIRILRPDELWQIFLQGDKPRSQSEMMYIFCTGFEWKEGMRVQELLWEKRFFNPESGYIDYQGNDQWDLEEDIPPRTIFLSYADAWHVYNHRLYLTNVDVRSYTAQKNIKRWASHIYGFDTEGISMKTLKRTRLAWLLHAFPERTERILCSEGWNPDSVREYDKKKSGLDAFLDIKWEKEESERIKAWCHGWDRYLIYPNKVISAAVNTAEIPQDIVKTTSITPPLFYA